MLQWLTYHLLPKAYSLSPQGDGPNGAGRVCSPAHLPLGEPEEKAGHHQLFGGETAADSGGMCDVVLYCNKSIIRCFFFFSFFFPSFYSSVNDIV